MRAGVTPVEATHADGATMTRLQRAADRALDRAPDIADQYRHRLDRASPGSDRQRSGGIEDIYFVRQPASSAVNRWRAPPRPGDGKVHAEVLQVSLAGVDRVGRARCSLARRRELSKVEMYS